VAAAASALAADARADAAALSEANALSSANAAAMVASPFTSGQTVAVGDVRYSPVDMLTYRAKTAGAHTADPSADATNWARISGNVIQSELASVVSPGFVGYFAMNSPPSGYLKANGAAVSRTTYAALFTAIGTTFGAGDGSTTFALPDLRGYFVRGWDDARGIDSGRAFGSNQADSNLSHTHTGSTNTTGAHTHSANTQYTGSGTGNLIDSGRQAYAAATTSAGDHSHTLSINSDGGTESRPKNVALLACIKF
jgi:phage-related tail fiber protein